MSIERKQKASEMLELLSLVEPFYREGDKVYMKFDRIDVDIGTQRLVFYWKGEQTISKPLDGMATPGNIITLGGIEGRSQVTFVD
jgi:hypothetical protein